MRRVAKTARLGLAIVGFYLLPTQVGLQDLGSLIAPRAAASGFPESHFIVSPFGTIHAPLIAFPRRAGTDLRDAADLRAASLDPNDGDTTGSIASRALIDPSDDRLRIFPEVNRRLKGDRLVPSEQPPAPTTSTRPRQGAANASSAGATFALASASAMPVDLPPRPDTGMTVPDDAAAAPVEAPAQAASATPQPAVARDETDTPSVRTASLSFAVASVGRMGTLQP